MKTDADQAAMAACDNALDALLLVSDADKTAIEYAACGVETVGVSDHARRILEIIGEMHQARLNAACDAGRIIFQMMVEYMPDKARAEAMAAFAAKIPDDARRVFELARAEHRAEHTKGMH